jgi:hypothetical protein
LEQQRILKAERAVREAKEAELRLEAQRKVRSCVCIIYTVLHAEMLVVSQAEEAAAQRAAEVAARLAAEEAERRRQQEERRRVVDEDRRRRGIKVVTAKFRCELTATVLASLWKVRLNRACAC